MPGLRLTIRCSGPSGVSISTTTPFSTDSTRPTLASGATPASVRLVRRGFNDVYELTAPERLYLRIGRQGRRTPLDAELEAQVLVQAQAAGAPVAVAIRGRNGRFAQRLEAPEGERAVLLFAAAPGSIAEDTPEHACAQGRALAGVHEAALEAGTVARLRRLDAELLVSQPGEWASEQLRDRPELVARFGDVVAGMRVHLERVQAGLSIGLCHGDCHGYNATVERGSATFFDFDESGLLPVLPASAGEGLAPSNGRPQAPPLRAKEPRS